MKVIFIILLILWLIWVVFKQLQKSVQNQRSVQKKVEIDEKRKRWIDERIKYLTGTTPVFNPNPEEFFLEPTPDFYQKLSGSLQEVQQAANIMAKKLKKLHLYTAPKIVWRPTSEADFEAGPNEISIGDESTHSASAGTYHGAWITINEKYKGNAREIGGILAHEMAHYFVSHNWPRGVPESVAREEEVLTDLTSVFLGFGKLVLNERASGYFSREEIASEYLSREEIAYAFKKVNELRRIKQEIWIKNLRPQAIELIGSID